MDCSQPLDPAARDEVRRKFYRIVEYFDHTSGPDSTKSVGGSSPRYNCAKLIRLTHDYAISPVSQDTYLRAFFRALELPIDIDGSEDVESDLDEKAQARFLGFADYLLNNFFLPIKASARKTYQPPPEFHYDTPSPQDGNSFVETPDRLSALNDACLIRDRHRCVVTRKFDSDEAETRLKRDGESARDDDGVPFEDDPRPFYLLKVAHILPGSLARSKKGTELNPSKQAALSILNMLDDGVVHLIEGADIDKPRNAVTLDHNLHHWFSNFDIFFEPVPDADDHTYRIGFSLPSILVRGILPVVRKLYLTEERTIEPPSPRLLAIHRAIAHILHLSGASNYINTILKDLEKAQWHCAEADGSTDLGRLVHLGLCLDGTIKAQR
ncbi:hypothetical protein F5144DRAFT_140885 [Chaetomium tenue]|uniref:Uncharacterized protein n=1 Tax=Chaetomium tenue TaxID=1854479 RepID=A0ACB7PMQ9_9PEZI|nr:hypothetical protein F5144DRAFT_140885 [Chaetomium globosum]